MAMSGMTIPSTVTSDLTASIATYFYKPVMNTFFQPQLIMIMIVVAALGLLTPFVFMMLFKFFSPFSLRKNKEFGTISIPRNYKGIRQRDARISTWLLDNGMDFDTAMKEYRNPKYQS